jgi:hypothetical protein
MRGLIMLYLKDGKFGADLWHRLLLVFYCFLLKACFHTLWCFSALRQTRTRIAQ